MNNMCIFCNSFRNRIRGYEELDSKRIGDETLSMGLEKNYSEMYLLVRIQDKIVSSVPVSHCPLCGEKIGELK